MCYRSPCVDELDPEKPTNIPKNPTVIPAVYCGETSRGCFYRGTKHLADYRAKLSKCALWRHTLSKHGGTFGPNQGEMDFRMVKIRKWTKPLDRQTAEGSDIMQAEQLAYSDRVDCINGKEDFRQSFAVTISYNMGMT